MFSDIGSIIWEPIEFIRRKSIAADSWLPPISIVVVTASAYTILFLSIQSRISTGVDSYLNCADLPDEIIAQLQNFRAMTYFISAAGGLSIIPLWIVGAAFATCWAILANGREDFEKVLRMYSYAHVPLLLYGIIGVLLLRFMPQTVHFQIPSSNGLSALASAITRYHEELTADTALYAVRVLGYAAQAWSLALLGTAASIVQRVSYFHGILAAAIYGALVLFAGRLLS